MKTERRGRQDACGTVRDNGDADEPYRRHLGGYTRAVILKSMTRGGVLAGIVSVCTVLANREERLECSDRCGTCPKYNEGNCSLGLR